MKNIILCSLLIITVFSCKKAALDNFPTDGLEATFSYTIDGTTVSFHNQSKIATQFSWDFGDGNTSSDKDPVHTYPDDQGKYLVTLTGTAPDGRTVQGSTVLNIDKGAVVKMDDNTLADWATVTRTVVIENTDANVVRQAKIEYDGSWVYILMEISGSLADDMITAVYVDKDNSSTTGFFPWFFPADFGADWEMEGQITKPEADRWFDIYKFIEGADQTGWNWDLAGLNDFYQMGHFEEVDGMVKFEMALRRDKLGLDGVEAIRLGVNILSSDWSDIGYMPESGSSGFLLEF